MGGKQVEKKMDRVTLVQGSVCFERLHPQRYLTRGSSDPCAWPFGMCTWLRELSQESAEDIPSAARREALLRRRGQRRRNAPGSDCSRKWWPVDWLWRRLAREKVWKEGKEDVETRDSR